MTAPFGFGLWAPKCGTMRRLRLGMRVRGMSGGSRRREEMFSLDLRRASDHSHLHPHVVVVSGSPSLRSYPYLIARYVHVFASQVVNVIQGFKDMLQITSFFASTRPPNCFHTRGRRALPRMGDSFFLPNVPVCLDCRQRL